MCLFNMKRIFWILLLLCSTMLVMAQEPGSEFNKNLVKSNVVQQIDNHFYYVHVIGAKQTLYSIAHLYGVPVSLICEINNIESGDNISEGQTIYIPIVEEEDIVVQEVEENPVIVEEVEENPVIVETEYTEPEVYTEEVTADITADSTNYADEAPVVPEPEILFEPSYDLGMMKYKSRNGEVLAVRPRKSETFNVALLIPLYYDNAKTLSVNCRNGDIMNGNKKPFRFVQFYQGAMIAIDSLIKMGMNINLSVYDVDEKVESANAVINSRELEDMDLIIGPFFRNSYKAVCEYAAENYINIVNPTTFTRNVMCDNSRSFKMNVDDELKYSYLVDYICNYYFDSSVIIYTPDESKDSATIDYITRLFANTADRTGIPMTVKVFSQKTDSNAGYSKYITGTCTNVIISLATSYPHVLDHLTRLNKYSKSNRIVLFGNESWTSMELDNSYLNNTNFHFISNKFIDYNDVNVKRFVKAFSDKYFSEPNSIQYAYLGYDTFFYYLNMLYYFGYDFPEYVSDVYYEGLESSLYFAPTKKSYGFENYFQNIYEIDDYSYKVSQNTDYFWNSCATDLKSLIMMNRKR